MDLVRESQVTIPVRLHRIPQPTECSSCKRPMDRADPKDDLCENCMAEMRHEILAMEQQRLGTPQAPASPRVSGAAAFGVGESMPSFRVARWEE